MTLFPLRDAIFAIREASNPNLNEPLKNRLADQKQRQIDQKIEKFTDLKYDLMSDVGTDSDKYPMVVLRTGYKLNKRIFNVIQKKGNTYD